MTDKPKTSKTKKVLIGVGALLAIAAITGAGSPPEETSKELVQQSSASRQDESKLQVETKTEEKVVTPPPPRQEVTVTQDESKPEQSQPSTVPTPASGNCNANYSGCVPNDSDVDCAGGSRNGPSYIAGPIKVIGTDTYDLDRDGNGIACE